MCLLTVLPVRRAALVMQKIAAMAAQAAALAATVAACVIAGRSFQLLVKVGDVASISAAAFLMAMDFGIVATAAGAMPGRRGTAIGAGSALAAASYLISSLAPVVSWLSPSGTPRCCTGRSATTRSPKGQRRRLRRPPGHRPLRIGRRRARVPQARCPLTPHHAARPLPTTEAAAAPPGTGRRAHGAASLAGSPRTCDASLATNART